MTIQQLIATLKTRSDNDYDWALRDGVYRIWISDQLDWVYWINENTVHNIPLTSFDGNELITYINGFLNI